MTVEKSVKKRTLKGRTTGRTVTAKIKKAEARIDKKKLKKEIKQRAGQVSESDVEEIVNKEDEISKKLKKVPGIFTKIINQIILLLDMIKSYWSGEYREIPWFSIAMSAAALLYFINPIDIIPDIIPLIGFVDDAFVVGFVIKSIQGDLKKYCAFKGYALEEFF
jgi:uncharacterized membrane protein YkvA (DUF1232 family)